VGSELAANLENAEKYGRKDIFSLRNQLLKKHP
jgi:hypothetical protein